MKTILTRLSFFILLITSYIPAQAQYSWKLTQTVPAPGRHHSSVFAIDENFYMICGTNTDESQQYKDMWKYIPLEDRWLQMKDFPGTPRSYAATFVINGKGYLTVGVDNNGTTLTDLWEYTPIDDIWVKKADFPGEGRAHPAFFTLNEEGYVGCGDGESGDYKDFYKYSPTTNKWVAVTSFAGPAHHHPAFFTINNKAYLCTGHDRAGNQVLKTNYEYNPITDAWTKKADFPGKARVGGIGFAINNKGFIGGGFDEVGNGEFFRDFYTYNPLTDTWSNGVPLFPDLNGTFAAVTTVIGNVAYAGTGMDSLYVSTNKWYSFRDESISVSEQSVETPLLNIITAKGYIRLESNEQFNSLVIVNQLGQTMVHSSINASNSTEISTHSWAKGIYCARYIIGTKVKNKSFVIGE